MSQSILPSALKLRHSGCSATALLERCFDVSPEDWDFSAWQTPEDLPIDKREKVQSSLAELAFWRSIVFPDQAADRPAWLNDICPFADSQDTLRQLLPYARYAAMAAFPLASQNGQSPTLARLYLLQDYPCRNSCCRLSFADAIPENCAVLLAGATVASGEIIEGDSWQLASELARKAIYEPALRLPLGSGWICTGSVDERSGVKPVKLGNKHELTRRSHRRWLLPDGENFEDWHLSADPAADGFGVRTLAEALTYVRESGIVTHQFAFPEDVGELHVLLGTALPPVLAVCMQIFPGRLCLWYSEQTHLHAEALEKVFSRFLPVELHAVPSDNMAVVEVRIRERLLEAAGLVRLVNITGGNRLMGLGAMLAARHCRVSMVYRDIDAPPDQLEMIDFADDPTLLPRNGKVSGNNCPKKWQSQVDWRKLYNPGTRLALGTPPDYIWLRQILWKEGFPPVVMPADEKNKL
ncbi:MAG: hypothetical protein WCT05_05130 [Lentisphaeria bacterium]